MATKTKEITSRLVLKHDIAANWANATNFVPKQGEIIIYDKDATCNHERIKVGDGETTVANLPFFTCDNGGDEKEMYGVDANKDGNVELIFGIKSNPIFTITDVYGIGEPFPEYGATLTFEFEEGMTWEQWIESKYNPDSSQINFEGDYVRISWGYVLRSDYTNAKRNDLIIANMQYKASN